MAEHGSPSEERLRLFVAIEVPEPVKEEIANAQEVLRQSVPQAAARWTRRDQFHLTLRFLGNVEAALVERLIGSLRTACRSIPALQLRASGIGFFPSSKSPRVVWVGARDPQDQLRVLHAAVEKATAAFSKEKSEERFTGHVTLGRVKDLRRRDATVLAQTAASFSTRSFGDWMGREIQLMRSRLSPHGAEHILMAAIPLAGEISPEAPDSYS